MDWGCAVDDGQLALGASGCAAQKSVIDKQNQSTSTTPIVSITLHRPLSCHFYKSTLFEPQMSSVQSQAFLRIQATITTLSQIEIPSLPMLFDLDSLQGPNIGDLPKQPSVLDISIILVLL